VKANIPAGAKEKLGTTKWFNLPRVERDAIHAELEHQCQMYLEEEVANVQEIWIKLCCILLREQYGFNEEQLLQFIVAWGRMYCRNERISTMEEQAKWLEEEMQKCFPTSGFPQRRIDYLKGKGRTK